MLSVASLRAAAQSGQTGTQLSELGTVSLPQCNAICAGTRHSLALCGDSVYAFGWSEFASLFGFFEFERWKKSTRLQRTKHRITKTHWQSNTRCGGAVDVVFVVKNSDSI